MPSLSKVSACHPSSPRQLTSNSFLGVPSGFEESNTSWLAHDSASKTPTDYPLVTEALTSPTCTTVFEVFVANGNSFRASGEPSALVFIACET